MQKLLLIFFIPLILNSYGQDVVEKRIYRDAYSELNQMLEGEIPLSFKRGIFITENAFLNNQLDYQDYLKQINGLVGLTKLVASTDGLLYSGKDRNEVLLSASIFRVLNDTIYVNLNDQAKAAKILPFVYDMDDFWGEKDWTKMFVNKLLHDHTGNCHSLPALYKIVADELGVKSWLSLAPNHTYIKQWNEKSGWYNTELTTGQFPFDADIKWNSYIKTEAIATGVYMDTLSSKESIAYVLTDLAQGYIKKFGYGDKQTLLEWINTSLAYYPDYVNALILKAELEKNDFERIMRERNTSDFKKVLTDSKIKEQFNSMEKMYLDIHDLGYRRMPKKMYLNWLFRIEHDTTHKPFQFSTPQPFAKYNYNVTVVTGGNGQNYEFFDQEELVQIGTVELNVRQRKIVSFVKLNPEEMPDEVISRMYDPALGRWWQKDPKSDKFSSESPYNFVHNNPIKFIDPDGQAPVPSDVILTVSDPNVVGSTLERRSASINITLSVVNPGGKTDLSETMFSKSSGTIDATGVFGGRAIQREMISGNSVDTEYDVSSVTITYKVVSSLDEVGKNDHVMMLADEIPKMGKEENNPIGRGELGGRASAVEKGTIASGTFNEVAYHELGHNLGLEHSGSGLMTKSTTGSTAVSERQKGTVVGGAGQVPYSPALRHGGTFKASTNYTTPSTKVATDFLKSSKITY